MKILILGGSGFLGFALVRKLALWSEVVATYFQYRPSFAVKWRYLDVSDGGKRLTKLLEQEQPAVIINALAMSGIDRCEQEQQICYQLNVLPNARIVEYCQRHPEVGYIFFSSSQVFSQNISARESERTAPLNYYGETKREAEEEARELPRFVIIRPNVVFGWNESWQHGNIFTNIYKRLQQGKSFMGHANMIRNPCYVEDIALMVEQIIQNKKNGIFHAGGEIMPMEQFARRVAVFFGFDPGLIVSGVSRQKAPEYNVLDCRWTEQELGIQFSCLQESLQQLRGVI